MRPVENRSGASVGGIIREKRTVVIYTGQSWFYVMTSFTYSGRLYRIGKDQ